MGVVDNGDDVFPPGVEVACFEDEASFAFVVGAVGFHFHGSA